MRWGAHLDSEPLHLVVAAVAQRVKHLTLASRERLLNRPLNSSSKPTFRRAAQLLLSYSWGTKVQLQSALAATLLR